jgi:hypothetical protein
MMAEASEAKSDPGHRRDAAFLVHRDHDCDSVLGVPTVV